LILDWREKWEKLLRKLMILQALSSYQLFVPDQHAPFEFIIFTVGLFTRILSRFITNDYMPVLITNGAELQLFKNARNVEWITDGHYYIRHPKIKDSIVLIDADEFERFIIEEQVIDILNYAILKCKPQKIKVEIGINNKKDFLAKLKVNKEIVAGLLKIGSPISGGVTFTNEENAALLIERDFPTATKETFPWIEDFPIIKDNIDTHTKGALHIHKTLSNNKMFGLDFAIKVGAALKIKMANEYLLDIKLTE
jgi:hypothetical protein